ncbi:MAG: carboxypeptidase-like regulatory domain-containing protein, partial [Gammaproteobacteria bacterium]
MSPIRVLALLVVILLALPVYAQTGQGTIVGIVTDATGAVIPSVSVRIVNPQTGFVHTAATNEEGLYRVPYLNPGMYELTFEASGFKKLVRSNIQVRSTETARVDVALEVGTVTEAVEVQAQAGLIET